MDTNEIKVIKSIDEITEHGIKYAHESRPRKWIQIDKDGEKEFCVYGLISGDQPTSVTTSNWNQVKVWKTFSGVVRTLKKYSQKGQWGMRHWDVDNKI